MEVITLYQKDSKDKIRQWSIYVEETPAANFAEVGSIRRTPIAKRSADIVTNAGLLGGKFITTRKTITEGKNLGKSNATTPYEQACSEARSTAELKRKDGYVERVDELKEKQTMGSGWKEPMLAQKYDPTEKQSSSKNLKTLKLTGKMVGTQRKKDGNRSYIKVSPNGTDKPLVDIRNRKTQPYLYAFPGIVAAIQKSYLATYGQHGPELILDGEFYTPVVSFNKLNGILKAKTLKPGYKEVLDSCNFHLFDMVSTQGYEQRHAILENFESPLVHVEAYDIIEATEENLLERLRTYMAEGEEGLMIRTLDAPYQHKRTWDLMKYKVDMTEDYKIIGMEEHAMGGMVGAVVFEAPAYLKDRDGKQIGSFKAGTTNLSHEESRQMWGEYLEDILLLESLGEEEAIKMGMNYLAKIGTVRFFEFSEYQIPRFPKFVGVRADA